jgi:ribonuclease Z
VILKILGCNGAIPAYGRFPTCQVIELAAEFIMIDCGEGAQMQLQKYDVRSSRIKHVCISHMHGDHYFGLIGWLTTQALLGREKPVYIYAPAALKNVINIQLDYALPYEVFYTDLIEGQTQILFENDKLEIFAFPVDHSLPTHGFRISEKFKKRVLLPEKISAYQIPKYFLSALAEGKDYESMDGRTVANELVTSNGKPSIIYSYSADTAYCESIIPFIENSNVLYHEATYLSDDLEKATKRKHSTATQAATIAKMAEVKQLIVGHYSSKYEDVTVVHEEAKSIFENCDFALEGKVWEVR